MALLKTKDKDIKKNITPYDSYRNSVEWRHIRDLILERDGYKCRTCGSTSRQLHIHHSTYEHLYDEINHLEDLITLCSCCHTSIHACKYNHQRFKKQPNKEK